jgi:hypothetical protein
VGVTEVSCTGMRAFSVSRAVLVARDLGGEGLFRYLADSRGIDPDRSRADCQASRGPTPPEPFLQGAAKEEAWLVIHISLPAGAPAWVVGVSLAGVVLTGLAYCLVRLVRAVLPDTSTERLYWWEAFWKYRRDLRNDRWARQELRRARRLDGQSAELSHSDSTSRQRQRLS